MAFALGSPPPHEKEMTMFEMTLQQDLGVLPVQHEVNGAVEMLELGQCNDGPPPPQGKLCAAAPGTTSLEIGQSSAGPPPPGK